ncbi:hypothetical protein ACFPK5_00275 [Streptomyces beijiangensis]|uniref:hypothetical protein n=1 Tax=Streptomyces beijiangensis TaxID=163361 RepID=UPI0031DCAFBA
MTRRRPAVRLAVAAAAALLLAGTTAGCSVFDDDAPAADPAQPHAPTPSGTGPYPNPPAPSAAATLPAGKQGVPHGGIPRPSSVNGSDATAVSRAALTVMTTYDTTLDTTLADASRRTAEAGWCTPTYTATLLSAQVHAAPGAQWSDWTAHRAYTTVQAQHTEQDGRPADTATTAYRQWTLTLTPTGRDGWTGPAEILVVFAELQRSSSSPWQLNAVTIQ